MYKSVINTAKNGELIRAEIREYVLAMGLINGFYQDSVFAELQYPNNIHRQKQCTMLKVNNVIFANPYLESEHLNNLVRNIVTTMTKYYKHCNIRTGVEQYSVIFYDTKKLRIYYNRLCYGKNKRIILKHTMQYIWTDILLVLMFIYGYDRTKDCIDLTKFWFYNNAESKTDSAGYILEYMLNICSIKSGIVFNLADNSISFNNTEEIIERIKNGALFVTNKLIAGHYIEPDK